MYKKIKLILVIFTSIILLSGCQQATIEEVDNKKVIKKDNEITISYEELSDKEKYLTTVTGNRVVMYNIENIPIDRNYKFELIYEEYEDGKKMKEDVITTIYSDKDSPKLDKQVLTLNYENDKIRFVVGEENGYYSGSFETGKKIDDKFEQDLIEDVSINLGDEVYIYQKSKGIEIDDNGSTFNSLELGTLTNDKTVEEIIKGNEEDVFIKLVYKEID